MRRLHPGAALLAAAGCASTPHEPPASRRGPTNWDCPARERDLHTGGVRRLVQGFDAPGAPLVQPLDRMLLGLSLVSPRLSDLWMLDVVCLGDARTPFTVTMTPKEGEPRSLVTSTSFYLIRVFDAEGASAGQSTVIAPSECLSHGFVGACAARGEVPRTLTFEDPRARGIAAMISLLETIQQDKVLADILWQVVDKPGLLTFLTTWSTTVTVTPEFERATRETGPLDPPWQGLETWSSRSRSSTGASPCCAGACSSPSRIRH